MTNEEICRQALERENPFMKYNHMEIEAVEQDRAVLRLDIRRESTNPYGYVHGGMLCSLADDVTAIAAHTDGRAYVSQSCSIYFIKNQKPGTIRAEARVRSRSPMTALVEVSITGQEGQLLVSGTYTMFCVDHRRDERK